MMRQMRQTTQDMTTRKPHHISGAVRVVVAILLARRKAHAVDVHAAVGADGAAVFRAQRQTRQKLRTLGAGGGTDEHCSNAQ